MKLGGKMICAAHNTEIPTSTEHCVECDALRKEIDRLMLLGAKESESCITAICFCECDLCKTKIHCNVCLEFQRAQEAEYEYLRAMQPGFVEKPL